MVVFVLALSITKSPPLLKDTEPISSFKYSLSISMSRSVNRCIMRREVAVTNVSPTKSNKR